MIEEPSINTKTDILDLVISFLAEHEKQMDQMIRRLERTAEAQSRRSQDSAYAPETGHSTEVKPNSFTITINAPNDLKHLKRVTIEWNEDHGAVPNSAFEKKMAAKKFPQTNTRRY